MQRLHKARLHKRNSAFVISEVAGLPLSLRSDRKYIIKTRTTIQKHTSGLHDTMI